MIQRDYTMRVLEAEEGFVLTQSGEVESTERVLTDMVYLGADDEAGNWQEISQEEAEVVRAAQHAASEARALAREGGVRGDESDGLDGLDGLDNSDKSDESYESDVLDKGE